MPENNDERREEMRADMPIQVRFDVLGSRDDYNRTMNPAPERMMPSRSKPDLEGRDDIERFLLFLDGKLDLIIKLLAEKAEKKNYTHTGAVIDVSESGIRMASPVPLKMGTFIAADMTLPHFPIRSVEVLAEVVWEFTLADVSKYGENQLIGIRFVDILPEDQDEIVYYIFQKQREELRRRRDSE